MSIPEGYGDDEAEPDGPACVCPREGLRDTCAVYLVHAGLRLATRDTRNRMMKIISEEWRVAVGRALSMARHPAGKGSARPPVHLADRMDAAYRERRRHRRAL